MTKTFSLEWKKNATHAIQLKLNEQMGTKQIQVIVTQYGRNKNLDELKVSQEKPILAPSIASLLLKTSVFQ